MRTPPLAFAAGLLFALGLGVSGMTDPNRVLGFLDLFGAWDPSLLGVMAGAVIVHGLAFRLIRRRASPWWAPSFALPVRASIDRPLLVGAAVFGVGWGIAGYCPGPVLVALSSGAAQPLVFVAAMAVGMLMQVQRARAGERRGDRAPTDPSRLR